MKPQDLFEEQRRVAMRNPEKLKEWLRARGTQYMTLNSDHLVDALWPSAKDDPAPLEAFMSLLDQYAAHRRTLESRYVEVIDGQKVPVHLDDGLEPDECDMACAALVRRAEALQSERKRRGAVLR